MHIIVKKLQVFAVLTLFLLSGIVTLSVNAETPLETVVYRYGPDGSIKPIRITLNVGEEFGSSFLDKCEDLLKNDAEMQSFISNWSFFSEIKSSGKGFHWKSPFSFRIPFTILFRYRLFKWMELKYRILGLNVVPRVYCNYSNDANAFTEINPVKTPARQNPNVTRIEGNHSITVLGFIGYAGWRGMSAGWFEKRDKETGFIGYSLFTHHK